MKRIIVAIAVLAAAMSCRQTSQPADPEVFSLQGEVDTLLFSQVPFEWKVTPRHDYSKMFTTKLFLCQAEYDGDFLGRYKMHDNGRQTVYLTIDQAYDVIKGMDQITLGIPKIVYLVGWQYNGHDSKYPAFFEGNEAVKRPEDEDALQSVRWLMEAAKEYNTAVSLHINMFDAFEDSPLFEKYRDADVLAKKKDGSLMNSEWGYKVCYAAEWEKGLAQERIDRLFAVNGNIPVDTLHKELGHICWEYIGMGRTEEGLKTGLKKIEELRKEFETNLFIPGTKEGLNVELDKAVHLDDFLTMGKLIAYDALSRNESCGGHFREEYQTEEGEAKRDDANYFYVGCWKYEGSDDKEPTLLKEPLEYEAIKVQTRNYKN